MFWAIVIISPYFNLVGFLLQYVPSVYIDDIHLRAYEMPKKCLMTKELIDMIQ